jgi:hypothetical protein
MRETAAILLGPDAVALAPAAADLDTLTLTLRGHLELLIPEVEQALSTLDKQDPARHCMRACLGDARLRLRAEPSPRHGGPMGHARRLARALVALCEHFEQSGGRS